MKHLLKRIFLLLVTVVLLSSATTAFAASPEQWQNIKGTYAREDNSQFNNGILKLMYLDNDCTLFEFKMMKGSESENSAFNFSFAGVMISNDDGSADYESADENESLRLKFDLKAEKVVVTQEGNLPVDVAGSYTLQEPTIEVSDEAAKEILEFLPTATTSLNHNNGEYALTYADEMVGGWFYDVKANFTDTKALIGEFWIAQDMSAVYRVDTDKPILIYGSAQPLMDAEYMVTPSHDIDKDTQAEDGNQNDETAKVPYSVFYVSAVSEQEAVNVGQTAKIAVTMPGNLPYTLEATSSDSVIAEVSKDGVITAKSAGQATIIVKLAIDDAQKIFELSFGGVEPLAENSKLPDAATDNTDSDTKLDGGDIAILAVLFLLAVGAVTGVVLLVRRLLKKKVA